MHQKIGMAVTLIVIGAAVYATAGFMGILYLVGFAAIGEFWRWLIHGSPPKG